MEYLGNSITLKAQRDAQGDEIIEHRISRMIGEPVPKSYHQDEYERLEEAEK